MCNIFKTVVSISTSVVLTSVAMATSAFAIKTERATDYSEYDGYQCVAFAKAMGADLPSGLYTPQDKRDLIQYGIDVCPEPGWVAIVRNGQHVGYVEDANEEDGTITVVTLDGNWIGGKVYRRTGTPKELEIKGYWAP